MFNQAVLSSNLINFSKLNFRTLEHFYILFHCEKNFLTASSLHSRLHLVSSFNNFFLFFFIIHYFIMQFLEDLGSGPGRHSIHHRHQLSCSTKKRFTFSSFPNFSFQIKSIFIIVTQKTFFIFFSFVSIFLTLSPVDSENETEAVSSAFR